MVKISKEKGAAAVPGAALFYFPFFSGPERKQTKKGIHNDGSFQQALPEEEEKEEFIW